MKVLVKMFELTFEAHIIVHDFGEPAKTWGLPENCHPGSPAEWEIEELRLNGMDVSPLLCSREIEDKVTEQVDRALAEGRYE